MYVYILHSALLGQYYVGSTASVTRRVKQHRRGGSRWSSRADDWRVVHTEEHAGRAAACAAERQIKARGAARYLADLTASQSRADAGQG